MTHTIGTLEERTDGLVNHDGLPDSSLRLGALPELHPAEEGLTGYPVAAADIDRQSWWEVKAVDEGVERYRREIAETPIAETKPGQRMLRDVLHNYIPSIAAAQEYAAKQLRQGQGGRTPWWMTIILLPPEKLALITARAILSARDLARRGLTGRPLSVAALEVGTLVKLEIELENWKVNENAKCKGTPGRTNYFKLFQAYVDKPNDRVFKAWRRRLEKKIDTLVKLDWTRDQCINLGVALLTLLVEHGGGYFAFYDLNTRGGKSTRHVILTEIAKAALADMISECELLRPFYVPMLCPPKPWVRDPMKSFDGGYYVIRANLLRHGLHQHTAANPEMVSARVLRAINVVQNTPWAINRWVLDLMETAWEAGDHIGGLPSVEQDPLPDKIPDDIWAAMTKEERVLAKHERASIHSRNAKMISQRAAFIRKRDIARSVQSEKAIYFPHFIDFRGRMYPIPQDLTPQGDDVSRALLQFSEGRPLGKRGVWWIAMRLANTFGMDKLTYDERMKWVQDHLDEIADSARDPLNGTRFWCEAEEPWSFLATCREWELAFATPGGPENFVSHLPIPLDGVCNGLQHLSLMGRDPVGARATNCTSDPKRYDLYTEVAAVVLSLVERDAAAGVPAAQHWIAKGVDRKTVKRAVMTTPYGVTARGIQDQLRDDGLLEDLEGPVPTNARYMQEKISEALVSTVSGARRLMEYFQTASGVLAERNIPLRWKTPLGMEVVQAYYGLKMRRVQTLSCTLGLYEESKDVGLAKRKQSVASSPNIVHSMDAAMLGLTATKCYDEHGIRSFAFIHDSYGTHACDTDTLASTLRNVAADMYADDWLAQFDEYVRSYSGGVELPAPPALGTFDPTDVLRAPYFFS